MISPWHSLDLQLLGAGPWATRASNDLRATGPKQHGADHGTQPVLSPQGREIAVLAATGLANKEIGARLYLSHRTVGAHLYRIFPKLGINFRATLADAPRAIESPRKVV
jgi:DNA-binding NarL/FixJ family response regulator